MTIKEKEWPIFLILMLGVLGMMGLGAWLVVHGHSHGWWLVIVPMLAIFL